MSRENPLQFHTLVRMVDRANRIHANPYHRTGLRLEESIIFRDSVHHHLGRLIAPVREAVLLMAEGYPAVTAAQMSGVSYRTVQRALDEVWVN